VSPETFSRLTAMHLLTDRRYEQRCGQMLAPSLVVDHDARPHLKGRCHHKRDAPSSPAKAETQPDCCALTVSSPGRGEGSTTSGPQVR